jgi:glycosyltransferase involved in cell wall biosynthesis
MQKLSVCIIAKNEDSILEKSLESIKSIADEIIFVDTGSTDKTLEIAKKYTDKVFYFEWVDDFSLAYQFAQDKASFEYVMRWDCDFILKTGSDKILELKERDFDGCNLINFRWNLGFLKDHVTRFTLHYFIWRKSDFYWESPIHANLITKTGTEVKKYKDLSIEVDHLKDRKLKDWRYSQTRRILEKTINIRAEDFRLWVFFTQGFFFEDDYDQAIYWGLKTMEKYDGQKPGMLAVLTEQIVFSLIQVKNFELAKTVLYKAKQKIGLHPRLVLIEADLLANFSIKKAQDMYLKFVDMNKSEEFYIYDYSAERFEVYPNLALAKIYFFLKDFRNASKYYNLVYESSIDDKLRERFVWQKRISQFLSFFNF